MSSLEIFCVTDKIIPNIEKTGYNIATPKNGSFPKNYLKSDVGENIIHKEKYYSELTFHYWYWKNMLDVNNNNWIGFCQKRRFWIKPESKFIDLDINNLNENIIKIPHESWKMYQSIICEPINLYGVKKIKLIKRGWKSLIKDPSIFFNIKKQTIKLHFDMHHGYYNLDKAIDLLEQEDREDFRNYVNSYNLYNPHLMFITKSKIANKWFSSLFPWLKRCEDIFSFKSLDNSYDTQRLYAFLAERYLSFWFKKYTKYKEHPWAFVNF